MERLYSYKKGRFFSEFDGFQNLSFRDILKWKFNTRGKISDENYTLTTVNEIEKLHSSKNYISWLGHSTFIIRVNNKILITDPLFGDVPLHKRRVNFPYKIEELPKVDYILISHSHYDHLDISSIKQLSKFNPKVIAPLGTGRYLQKIANIEVIELEWFQSIKDNIQIRLLPAKHWGRRGAFDLNKTLWGSFLIDSIYFAGDTSYSNHFKMIGDKYQIDIALLPIGAYRPEYIMKSNHINPAEAIQGALDLKTRLTIPMHYGTFKLSDEPMSEPIEWFKREAKEKSVDYKTFNIGEVFFL